MSYSVPGLNCVKSMGAYMIDIYDEGISVFSIKKPGPICSLMLILYEVATHKYLGNNSFGILTPSSLLCHPMLCCCYPVSLYRM